MATEPNIISPNITTSDEHLEPWRREKKQTFLDMLGYQAFIDRTEFKWER